MKTAISLPDSLYEKAEQRAKALGIPRSQLYAKALEEYLAKYSAEQVTEALDRVYGKARIVGVSPRSVLVPHVTQPNVVPQQREEQGATEEQGTTEEQMATIEALQELTRDDTW